MYNKERVKTIVSEWFDFKTGIVLSDETLSKLVDDITECKQCDIPVVVGRSEQSYCDDKKCNNSKGEICNGYCKGLSEVPPQ